MFPLLHLGSVTIQTPGLILLLAIWAGLEQSEKHARRVGINPNRLDSLVLIALVSGVAGARLAYAAHSPSAFAAAPLSLFLPTPSMLDPGGGLVVAILSGWIYAYRIHKIHPPGENMPLWPTLDALTPGLAIFMIGLGLAHLASGDAFGAPTSVPWAIHLWGAYRHPTQAYEILAAVSIAAAIWPRNVTTGEEADLPWPIGARFLVFAALSAGARLFLEAFRGDSALMAGGVHTAQVAAWFLLSASLWLLGRKFKLHAS